MTGKTGENFPPDGTVQFFLQKNGTEVAVPFDSLLFVLVEYKGASKTTTLKPQINKYSKKGLQ